MLRLVLDVSTRRTSHRSILFGPLAAHARASHSLSFATLDAEEISGSKPAEVSNLVQGKWKKASNHNLILDPLNGEPFLKVSDLDEMGIKPFVESLSSCPKYGLHNPLRSQERYMLFGDISAKAASRLAEPEISHFFTRLIQRVSPKSYKQALAEVQVSQIFFENFSGDQVRFLARSFAVPGNHLGQQSNGFRWPYGPVAIITPFNFPLEIPVLQLMGALYMGNKPVLKVDSKVNLKHQEDKYGFICEIIDKRWNRQMRKPLHAAALYLNPGLYYDYEPGIESNAEIKGGLFQVINILARSHEDQNAICSQLAMYRTASGGFGLELAINARKTYAPGEWWTSFGYACPELQQFAIRILSLTCSSSPCERNWSTFEMVSIVMEQMLRLLHECGLDMEDVDFINTDGYTMNKLLLEANPRMTLFTGSSRVAEKLAVDLQGRIKLEDAGFDWKILGPDVQEVDYVAWVCDQDAYACSGQKCSAQSVLFMHENWSTSNFISKLEALALRRKLEDLTIGPVLTVTTERMLEYMLKLLEIPGSKLLFGGEPLENHDIPQIYGAIKPTAVFVPLAEMMKDEHFEIVTTEIFGPFQIITEYKKDQLDMVLDICERMHAHLTAAVVSNDPLFLQDVLGRSVNGTTYAGMRARTTGAPQNHWFGPAGDPRGAGIGTPEAIKLVWSCHREIIYDVGPLPPDWEIPPST